MMYDSIRIIGLRISTDVNKGLIKLHGNAADPEHREEVLQSVINLCFNSMLLKQTDKHFLANYNRLKYSMEQFADLIVSTNLKSDFDKACAYHEQLKVNQAYPGAAVNSADFSTGKPYAIAVSQELNDKISEHQNRINDTEEWKSTDADLLHQYKKNFEDFKVHMQPYIMWHMKLLKDQTGQLLN